MSRRVSIPRSFGWEAATSREEATGKGQGEGRKKIRRGKDCSASGIENWQKELSNSLKV